MDRGRTAGGELATPQVIIEVEAAADLGDGLARLAAARSAIDPERRARRSDILSDCMLNALAVHGGLPADRVHAAVQRMWATGSITKGMIQRTLQSLADAGLVRCHPNMLSGDDTWELTDTGRAECGSDAAWAKQAFDAFTHETMARLGELLDQPVRAGREEGLAGQLFQALAAATVGAYDIAGNPVTLDHVRPAEFDLKGLHRHIREHVKPAPVAEAMTEVSLGVANPDDSYGNDILRLLVVGNMLQGILTGQNLHQHLNLEATRLLLDTSVLVMLADFDGGKDLLAEAIGRTIQAGAKVEVADHTIDEWERLWDAADAQIRGKSDQDLDVLVNVAQFSDGPFLPEFMRQRSKGHPLSWARFMAERRQIEPLLDEWGVRVRPSGNTKQEDRDLSSRLVAAFDSLREAGRSTRRPNAANCDAESGTMIARWRTTTPGDPPHAWLIANDTVTNLAYEEANPTDPYPVSMNFTSWTIYLSTTLNDSPEARNRLVDALSEQTTRDAFLAASTSYSLDDVLAMSSLLADPATGIVTQGDAYSLLQMSLLDLLNGEPPTSQELAFQTQQRRSHRRDGRARRATELAEHTRTEAKEQAEQARREGEHSGRSAERALLQPELEDARRQAEDGEKWRTKYRRLGVVSLLGGTAVVTTVVGGVLGWITGLWLVLAVLALFALAASGYEYVTNPDRTITSVVVSMLVAITLLLAEQVVGQLLTQPPTP